MRILSISLLLLFFAGAADAQWLPLNPIKSVEPQPDGAEVVLQTGYLHLQVCSESIVHIIYSLEREVPKRPDLIIVKTEWPKADFKLDTSDAKTVTLTTTRLKIIINRENSSLIFQDASGHQLAEENTRSLSPVEVNGERTLHAERFVNMWGTQEAFFGLGQ